MGNGQRATGNSNGNGNGTINQMMEATKSSGMAPCAMGNGQRATHNGKGNGNGNGNRNGTGIESNNQPNDGVAWRHG